MVSKVGAKEFKKRVKATLMKVDNSIKEDDLYFSQTAAGYYIEYKPKYPNRSDADFIVYQDLVGSVSVHGNMSALVPTIEHFEDIDDFEQKTLTNRCINCNGKIEGEYFDGVNGKICIRCLKELCVYHGLKSLEMIKES